MIRLQAFDALKIAQDVVERQDFFGSLWRCPFCCGRQLPSRGVFAEVVEVEPVRLDPYGRTVAFVKVGDTVVNEGLIRQGLARMFSRYCDRAICQEWRVLEAEAREQKRGLWPMPNALPPWEFRRSK